VIEMRKLAAAVVLACVTFGASAALAPGHGVGLRFVGTPIVPIGKSDFGPTLEVVFRVNKGLPRYRSGHYRARIQVQDIGGNEPILSVDARKRHCYIEELDQDFSNERKIQHPKPGTPVEVRLFSNGHVVARAKTVLTRGAPVGELDAPYERTLGCRS
jgi:hypothetical protein